MKRFLLSILSLMIVSVTFAQGKDDFSTLTANQSYAASLTTTAGWTITNAAVQQYGTGNTGSTFEFVPQDTKAVCINGKTTTVGTITSPVISGGVGSLKINYAYGFTEANGVNFKVEIKKDGAVIATQNVVDATIAKLAVGTANLTFAVPGNVQIVITNNSPSNSTSNKDRYSLWGIEWTAGPSDGGTFVGAPSITPASGTYYSDQEVTMTAGTGNTIVYTINGGAETTYSQPFTLTAPGAYTVAAYAKDASDNKSEVTTNVLDLQTVTNYTNIADLRAACTATAEATAPMVDFSFTELLVTGVNGSNVFVSDGTLGYLLYGTNALTLAKGDKISGKVQGKLYTYNGLGELAVKDSYANVTKVSSGNAVTPKVTTITDAIDLYATTEATYVTLQNVTFGAATISYTYGDANYKTVSLTDDNGDAINLYDVGSVLKTTTFDTTKKYNVNCYVVKHDPSVQVYVLSVDDISIITDLQIPVTQWSAATETITVDGTATAAFSTTSDGAVSYSSSDETIATVSAEGVITGVSVGKCTITATTAETATYLGSTAAIEVTVQDVIGGIETFTNGGFEDWITDSQPKNWKSATSASSATLAKSTDSHSGSYAVVVKHAATSNKRLAYKEMNIPAGWYTVLFYAKSVNDVLAQARPGYAPWDAVKATMGTYTYGDYTSQLSNTEWTLVTYTFNLAADAQINLVVMNPKDYTDAVSGTTTVYGDLLIDDFEFRAATESEITATGINTVNANKGVGVLYNLSGNKVSKSFRGIVIENGNKYLKK